MFGMRANADTDFLCFESVFTISGRGATLTTLMAPFSHPTKM